MLWVLPPEIGEELAGLELQIGRQRSRLQIGLFKFQRSALIFLELKDDVSKSFEIGIHCSVEGDLGVAQGEAAADGIVVAEVKFLGDVVGGGPAGIDQGAKTNIHVSRTSTGQRER